MKEFVKSSQPLLKKKTVLKLRVYCTDTGDFHCLGVQTLQLSIRSTLYAPGSPAVGRDQRYQHGSLLIIRRKNRHIAIAIPARTIDAAPGGGLI